MTTTKTVNVATNPVVKNPDTLIIDRAKLDPKFFDDLTPWADSSENELKSREKSLLVEIDVTKILFVGHVTAEYIQLDSATGQALLKEKGQTKLHWLCRVHGVRGFKLAGTPMRDREGGESFLCLFLCETDGNWSWLWAQADGEKDLTFECPFAVLPKQ
ncbi:MAG: hypothetical protein ABSB00_03775 [Minisyncoccia bacterium]|jgi:hypothetical protein